MQYSKQLALRLSAPCIVIHQISSPFHRNTHSKRLALSVYWPYADVLAPLLLASKPVLPNSFALVEAIQDTLSPFQPWAVIVSLAFRKRLDGADLTDRLIASIALIATSESRMTRTVKGLAVCSDDVSGVDTQK